MTDRLTSPFSLPGFPPAAVPASVETETLCRRLRKLSRRTRQVFLLNRLDHLTYAEIAQWLELDVETVERCMVRLFEQSGDENAEADAIVQQARRWYVHLQSPQATPSQRIEFRHWLDADVRHLEAFQNTERHWRALQAPAQVLGANGWHRRRRRLHIGWLLLTAFLCSLLVTAEAFSLAVG